MNSTMPPWDRDPRFRVAHEVTDGYEGGASRSASDAAAADVPPGAVHTYRGIRASTWRAWCDARGLGDIPVEHATVTQVRELYWAWYWRAAGCHLLVMPLDQHVFDAAVHHGSGTAARILQGIVGARADGKVGPATQAAAAARDPNHTAERLGWSRLRLFHGLAADPRRRDLANLRGWVGRILDLRQEHTWAGGVPRDRPHREEWALWIELRELHARAAREPDRRSLMAGIPRLVERRLTEVFHGLPDPRPAGLPALPEPEPRAPRMPWRPVMAVVTRRPEARAPGARVLPG